MAGDKKKKKEGGKSDVAKGRPGLTLAVIMVVTLGLVSLPAMILLIVGMLPSLGAALGVSGREGYVWRALSVALMNFAGCFPFLLKLLVSGVTLEKGIDVIADPMVIAIIYGTAGCGYVIDAVLAGYMASFLYSRAQGRVVQVESRQKDLIERWGEEVTGRIPLDEEGFPIQEEKPALKKKQSGR